MEMQFFVEEVETIFENAIFENEPYTLRFVVEMVAGLYNLSAETADEIFEIADEIFTNRGSR